MFAFKAKIIECSIINPAGWFLMKHLVTGQRHKACNFLAFHWSPHGCLVSIGQHFVTTRVVHLPKRTERSLITELHPSGPYHRIRPGCVAMHGCNSWLYGLNASHSPTASIPTSDGVKKDQPVNIAIFDIKLKILMRTLRKYD